MEETGVGGENRTVGSLESLQIKTELHQGFQLGDVLVEPDQGAIVRDGQRFHVAPKAMEVLLLLASHAGDIVDYEQILLFAWGDKSVSKRNLTHSISELRHVLDDKKECPTYIQTLPRKGYRLIMPAIAISESFLVGSIWPLNNTPKPAVPSLSNKKTSSPSAGPWSLLRRSRMISVGAAYIVAAWVLMQVIVVALPVFDQPDWTQKLAALILAAGFPLALAYSWFKELSIKRNFLRIQEDPVKRRVFFNQAYFDLGLLAMLAAISSVVCVHLYERIEVESSKLIATTTEQALPVVEVKDNAVAVMPFEYHGEETATYIIDTLKSELTAYLSSSSWLKVASERAVSSLPESADLNSVRVLLGVRYLLEGRVSQQGEKIQVRSSIVDSENGFQIWSDTVEGSQTRLLDLQQQVSLQIINALQLLMPSTDNGLPASYKPTEDFQAYDMYVKGKSILRNSTELSELQEAETLFLSALDRDAEFGLAMSALCETHLRRYSISKNSDEFAMATQACQQSMMFETNHVQSQIALGNLFLVSGQYTEAELYFKNALILEPEASAALTGLASANIGLNRPENAEALYRKAIQVEPGFWRNYQSYGGYLFASGRYSEASLQFQRQSMMQPDSAMAFNNLGAAYFLNGNAEKASEAWQRSLDLKPSANAYSNLGSAYFFSRKFRKAAEMYEKAATLQETDYILIANLADALKYIPEQKVKALDLFRQSLAMAQDNLQINPNDMSLKAIIVRLESELDMCEDSEVLAKEVLYSLPDDIYVLYDLALASVNCSSRAEAKEVIRLLIEHGYPKNLLLNDHQFTDYYDDINSWVSSS